MNQKWFTQKTKVKKRVSRYSDGALSKSCTLSLGDQLILIQHCGDEVTLFRITVVKCCKRLAQCRKEKGQSFWSHNVSIEGEPDKTGVHAVFGGRPYDRRSVAYPIAMEAEASAEYAKRGGK